MSDYNINWWNVTSGVVLRVAGVFGILGALLFFGAYLNGLPPRTSSVKIPVSLVSSTNQDGKVSYKSIVFIPAAFGKRLYSVTNDCGSFDIIVNH